MFTFKSRNEFVNFSESGLNKIDQLWRWGRWKKMDQENQMVKIWCACVPFCLLKKSRNVLARDDASGDSRSEFEGFR